MSDGAAVVAVMAPRAAAMISGSPLAGVVAVEVNTTNLFVPDTFTLTLARSLLAPPYDEAYWANATSAPEIDIYLGYAAGSAGGIQPTDVSSLGAPLQTFLVEHFVDQLVGDEITLSGRDLSAYLVEAKTAEKFANQSASQIVQTLAARHNLEANVGGGGDPAGLFYEADQTRITSHNSEWELLVALAQQEGCNVWVTGHTLNFQPAPQPGDAAGWTITLPAAGAEGPATRSNILLGPRSRLERKLLLAGTIEVTVKSWHSQYKKTFQHTATSTNRGGSGAGNTPQVYTYNFAGRTDAQVKAKAQQIAEEIARHERVIEVTMPGDSTLSAQTLVAVTGTGTAFDQSYFLDEIRRHCSLDDGYVMELCGKNHSPRDVTVS